MNRENAKPGGRKRHLALAAIMLSAVMLLLPTGMAQAINLKEPVSVTADTTTDAIMAADMAKADIVMDIYKIASAVEVSGFDTYTFKAESAFSTLDVVNGDLKAEDWDAMAADAAALIFRDGAAEPVVNPVVKGANLSEGSGNMEAGMYLILARGRDLTAVADYAKQDKTSGKWKTIAKSARYEYSFDPILLALPSRSTGETYVNEADASNMTSNNDITWQQNVKILLKAEREKLISSIKIVKTLKEYETKDPATFVFQVEANLTEETTDGPVTTKVYSNVIPMVFGPSSTGRQEYPINNLPAGAEVTIKEVYKGANYKIVTGDTDEKTGVVSAEEIVEIEFTNDYNDTYHGGGSVTNKYAMEADQEGSLHPDFKEQIKDDQE